MASFTLKATGNFSAAGQTTWNEVGVPTDGDDITVAIAATLTIDQDLGTAGNGIKQFIINHASAIVLNDSSAPRNYYFACTGTNPTGGGTKDSPTFASANAFGFHVAKGTLRLKGTAANPILITSGNDTHPTYIYHAAGSLGGASQNATLDLQYCHLKHAGFVGIDQGAIAWTQSSAPAGNSTTMDHCMFTDNYLTLSDASGTGAVTFTFNYVTTSQHNTLNFSTCQALFTITDNTETAPATSAKRFLSITTVAGAASRLIFERNALFCAGANNKALTFINGGTWGSPQSVKYNYRASPAASGSVMLTTAATDTAMDVTRCIDESAGNLISVTGAGVVGDVHENIALLVLGSGAQGNLIISATRGNPLRIHHNITALDSIGNNNLNIFWYKGSGSGFTGTQCYHNTVVGRTLGGTSKAIAISEGIGGDLLNICRDNIVQAFGAAYNVGISDAGGPTSANTYPADFAGAGVHHNNVFNATTTYLKNTGSTNFDDGVTAHPSATYGDVSVDSSFVDPWRTGLGFDTLRGGPGTLAHLFGMYANRCGMTGTAYDAAYDIANLWAYLWAGWQPQAAALHAASDNVSPSNGWIGAVAGASGGGHNSIAAIAHTRSRDRKQRVCVAKRNRR